MISHFAGAIHPWFTNIFPHVCHIWGWRTPPQRHVVAHYGGSFSQCGNLKWAIDKDLWICHEYHEHHGMMLSYVINPIESFGPEWNHFCCCPSKFWGVLGMLCPCSSCRAWISVGFGQFCPRPREARSWVISLARCLFVGISAGTLS